MDIERWKCASRLFAENPPSGFWDEFEDLVTSCTSDWPPLRHKEATIDISVWLLLTIAGSLYGGLHALPWSSDFPTNEQRRLRQASVLLIITVGPLLLLCFQIINFVRFITQRRAEQNEAENERHSSSSKKSRPHVRLPRLLVWLAPIERLVATLTAWIVIVLSWIMAVLAGIGAIAGSLTVVSICTTYCLARIFLVVECLVALFHSSPGVFTVPSWSLYFPHIT